MSCHAALMHAVFNVLTGIAIGHDSAWAMPIIMPSVATLVVFTGFIIWAFDLSVLRTRVVWQFVD